MFTTRKTTAAVLAAAAGLAMGQRATAQADSALNWSNAAGGSASTTTNWAPNQMPAAADDLTFNLLANYTVTFTSLVPSAHTHTYKRGNVTLVMSSPHTVSNGIIVGDLNTDLATATLTTGTWNSGGPVTIGNAAGSNGTLAVNDDDADFIMTGTTSDMIVGSNAPGTLSITGGGLVQVADQFIAGSNAAGTSTVTVSGATSTLPLVRSTLSVLGTGVSSKLGQGGDATVNISNGGLADFAGAVVVSNGSASASTVTIAGTGGILPQNATLDVAGDLLLARNTTAAAAAGVATLNVNAGGRAVVGGTLFVAGDPDGGTATLHMVTGGQITTESFDIGNGFTLDLDGGNLDINGGTLAWSATSSSPRFNGGVGNPVITMINGAAATLTPTAGGLSLIVGGGAGANFCDFDVRSGSDLTTTGSVTIGEGSDDDGSMIISGAGSTMTMPTTSTLTVGIAGVGRDEAEAGGTVSGGTLVIAAQATSTAGALFESPGTTATFQKAYVGGTSGAAGGNGDLTVNVGAVLDITALGTALVVWPGGHLEVSPGAVLNALSATVSVQGVLEMENGGVLNAALLNVTGPGVLRGPNDVPGSATVNATTQLFAGATLELVNGDLVIGDSGSVHGFHALDGSLVSVGSHTLTLLDQDHALLDTVTINGGQIIAPNGLEIVTPGTNGTLDGTGTITTSELFMESGGSVITATGAAGITINGKFRNNSGLIDGTLYTFNNNPAITDSGWTGAGTIDAKVVFNSGTEVNALANMTMGDGSTGGVTFNAGSELHCDTRTVTLLDSNGLGLPSLTDFNNGTVVCAQPLVVNVGRTLAGRSGHVTTPTLTIFGNLSPGHAGGPQFERTGEMTVNGTLTMGVNSNFNCELQGILIPVDFDRLVVNGTVNLGGDLNISFINGFVPSQQDRFEIIRATSVVGQFAHVNIVGPVPPSTHVVYFADKVRIEFCYPNCDQSTTPPILNVNDFGCFLNRFAAGDLYANCDNSVGEFPLNVLDFACFLNSYAAGCQ